MPDHFHGLIFIRNAYGGQWTDGVDDSHGGQWTDVGVAYMRPLQRDVQRDVQRDKMLLPKIIHEFKSAVTRIANQNEDEYFQWQRSYYDHIVRDAWDLRRITNYIKNNPKNWKNILDPCK
ncbi:MAG: transposase [Patescibacteria group bacterium]|nr:transposase [Patescibacteria group bacterium]